MHNHTHVANEKYRRSEAIRAARAWLDDARTWLELAKHVNTKAPTPLNVVCGCTALAFQLIYNSLIVAEDKRPREKDGIEKSHRRLKQEIQCLIEEWVSDVGFNDCRKVPRTLDEYIPPKRNPFDIEPQNAELIRASDIANLFEMIPNLLNLAEQSLTEATNALQEDEPNHDNDLDAVLGKIQEIVKASEVGEYIFRGERECYDKTCSSLYRHFERDIDAEKFKFGGIQDEMLKEAKAFVKTDTDFEILTQLQHYGGKTNFIDFTTDFLIALYFACDGSHDEDGRIVLLEKSKAIQNDYKLTEPQIPQNRVLSQKSIFVTYCKGFIEPNRIIKIPRVLKQRMLYYLRKHHRISTQTIYNDLDGYIKYETIHQPAYAAFWNGVFCHVNGQFDNAIEHYGAALALNSDFAAAYSHRGAAYNEKNERDLAIKDFTKAIEVSADYAFAHHNRGLAYYHENKCKLAIKDFDKAIELDPGDAKSFNTRGVAHNKLGELESAVRDFTKAISINPNFYHPFYNRGKAYYRKEEYDLAINDLSKAVVLNPECGRAYFYRGMARLHSYEWTTFKVDLTTATRNGVNIASEFSALESSVGAFERKIGVELPEDIAALLQSSL